MIVIVLVVVMSGSSFAFAENNAKLVEGSGTLNLLSIE